MRMRCKSSEKGSNFRKSNFPPQCLKSRPFSSFTPTLLRMRLGLTNHPIPSTILRPWVISLDESCIFGAVSYRRRASLLHPHPLHGVKHARCTKLYAGARRGLVTSRQVVHPRLFVRPLGTSPSTWPRLGRRRGDNTCSCIQPFCPLPMGRVHHALFVSPTINMQVSPHFQRWGGKGPGRVLVPTDRPDGAARAAARTVLLGIENAVGEMKCPPRCRLPYTVLAVCHRSGLARKGKKA
ncbi:hypothetical protein B0T18DRAFT_183512 [Schizothecium vesticola]|uniref:Uncharacterized protein n=1 Tax=Schizothecium vesticola TaxID=314040 RepID=A0AA40EQ12_9PEZI|nr:hypothetical protein B0T18DRAFT_183512 [Schizothecium vesticola]